MYGYEKLHVFNNNIMGFRKIVLQQNATRDVLKKNIFTHNTRHMQIKWKHRHII